MFTPTDLVSLKRVQDLTVAPDGTWAVVTVDRLDKDGAKYLSDLHRVDLSNGETTRITTLDWKDSSPQFDGAGALYFLSNRPTEDDDKKHDKRSQIWRFDGVGDPVQVSFEPLGVERFTVCLDGTIVYRCSVYSEVAFDALREYNDTKNEQGPSALRYTETRIRYWDHWFPNTESRLVSLTDGDRNVLVGGDIGEWVVTKDAKTLYFTELRESPIDRNIEGVLRKMDVATEAFETVWDEERSGAFSLCAGLDRVAFLTSKRSDKTIHLSGVRIHANGRTEQLIADHDDRVQFSSFDDDHTLWMTSDQLGCGPIFTLFADGAFDQRTSQHCGGTHTHVAACAGGVCGLRSTATTPPEVFFLAEGSLEPETITSISGYTEPRLTVENVFVESTDGTPIHVRHIRTPGDDVRPLLVWIHGGPFSVWGDVWHWRWNPVVAASYGYHVICPNPRGSVGFGQQFVADLFGDTWGGQCYEDVMATAEHAAGRDDVDGDRSCAMGGSFGGYMTNWIGTQTDRFSCLVTHASIADNHGFYGTTDGPAFWMHLFQKNPYEDRTAFDRYSPLRHVANWKSPVLIVHGDKDYRVPVTESLTLHQALKYYDVDSDLMIFPDENHWILKPKNTIYWYEEIFEFIGRHTSAVE